MLIGKYFAMSPNEKLRVGLPSNKARILLYSSFTPFVIIFTHALASKDREDIHLLEQVLASLDSVSRMSEAGFRLYQLCSAFIRVTKAVATNSQQQSFPSFGYYDDQNGSLTFPMYDGGGGYSFTGYEDVGTGNDGSGMLRNDDLDNVSAFLGSWLGENTASNGIFNFGEF